MESMPGLSELPYTDNTDRKGALWASIQADRRVCEAVRRDMEGKLPMPRSAGGRRGSMCPWGLTIEIYLWT